MAPTPPRRPLCPPATSSSRDTWFADDGLGGYNWGVVYENTSTTGFDYVDVTAEFLDDAGTVLATSDTSISLATPGVGALAYFTYDLESPPTSMQVTIGDGDPSDFSASGTLTVGPPTIDESFGTLTGLITSTYATDLLDATITAVWRDGSGAVINISEDYVDAIQANGDTWFSLYVSDTSIGLPTEMYVGLSPLGFEPSAPAAELAIRESLERRPRRRQLQLGGDHRQQRLGHLVGSGDPGQVLRRRQPPRHGDSSYLGRSAPGANAVTSSLYGAARRPRPDGGGDLDGGSQDDDLGHGLTDHRPGDDHQRGRARRRSRAT